MALVVPQANNPKGKYTPTEIRETNQHWKEKRPRAPTAKIEQTASTTRRALVAKDVGQPHKKALATALAEKQLLAQTHFDNYEQAAFGNVGDQAGTFSTLKRQVLTDTVDENTLMKAKNSSPRLHALHATLQPNLLSSDLTVGAMSADLTKGAFEIKKKKADGVRQVCAVANQVWAVDKLKRLRCYSQSAKLQQSFDGQQYTCVAGLKNRVYAATKMGHVHTYDTQSQARIQSFVACEGASLKCIVPAPYGLWVAGKDGHLRLFDYNTGSIRREHNAGHAVKCMALSHHSMPYNRSSNQPRPFGANTIDDVENTVSYDLVWAGLSSGFVSVFDLRESYCEPSSVKAHQGGVRTIACDSRNQIWSGGRDNNIRVWNTSTLKPSKPLVKHAEAVTRLTQVGGKMWAGSWDGKVSVWGLKNHQLIGVLPGIGYSKAAVLDVAVVGLFIWLATSDNMLRVFLNEPFLEKVQDKATYNLPIHDLEELLSKTLQENSRLHKQIRALLTQLRRCPQWEELAREAKTDSDGNPKLSKEEMEVERAKTHIDGIISSWASRHEANTMADLFARLEQLEKRWYEQRKLILGEWQLPWMSDEWESSVHDSDQLQLDAAELYGAFCITEARLVLDQKRLQEILSEWEQKNALHRDKVAEAKQAHEQFLEEHKVQLERLQEREAELRDQIPGLEKRDDADRPEVLKHRSVKTEAERLLAGVQRQHDDALSQLEKAKKAEQDVHKQIKDTMDKIVKCIADRDQTLKKTQNLGADLEAQKAELDSKIRIAKADKEDKEKQIQQQKIKNDALEHKVKRKDTRVSELKSKLAQQCCH
eukprot:gnl/Hemi2/15965_TR5275_c0_g2_i1.p1 gnl/Hemi2/15965_TR5275_c0_g2~~gnl/Hemi2/15965_TR5275_c0_g2_i1.p1  ORF type:complete len:819 (-),score=375.22 gnl/Hemi2/15965_TR5275_c0_g2_i1:48-2504(-)